MTHTILKQLQIDSRFMFCKNSYNRWITSVSRDRFLSEFDISNEFVDLDFTASSVVDSATLQHLFYSNELIAYSVLKNSKKFKLRCS